MKIKILWAVLVCLMMGVICSGKAEKKIVFKKKIYASQAVAPKKVEAVRVSPDNYITVWIHGVSLFRPNKYNLGLWPAHTFIENESLFGIGKHLVESDPVRFPAEHVLMYSWNGRFDYQECDKASGLLYDALLKAIRDYTAQNQCVPKIRIITFSYGGNIAFSLANFKKPHDGLVIDELILLAWPVQNYLASQIKDPMFKKIFNVYLF